jgi:hypothetical protein
MRALVPALLIAAAIASADAKPAKPDAAPEPAAIKHTDAICKTTGGFGRVFGRGNGHVDTTASDDWAPFEKLTIEQYNIVAEASFRGTTDTLEGDVAIAEKFFKTLSKAIAAKGHFKRHDSRGNGVVFENGKEAGPMLELSQEQDRIIATCRS